MTHPNEGDLGFEPFTNINAVEPNDNCQDNLTCFNLFGLFSAEELQPAAPFQLASARQSTADSRENSDHPEHSHLQPHSPACAWEDVAGVQGLGWPYCTEPEKYVVGNKTPRDEFILIQEHSSSLYAYNASVSSPIAEPQRNAEADPSLEFLECAHPQPHHSPPPDIPRDAGNRCEKICRGIFAGSHKCSYRGRALTITCQKCSQEFARRNEFNRHWKCIHGDVKLFDCPIADCNRIGKNGFTRKDNVTQHRRNFHGENIAKNPVRFGRGDNARDLAIERVGSAGE